MSWSFTGGGWRLNERREANIGVVGDVPSMVRARDRGHGGSPEERGTTKSKNLGLR